MNAILVEIKNKKQATAIRAVANAIGSKYGDANDIALGLFLNKCRESKSLSEKEKVDFLNNIKNEFSIKK